MGCTAPVITTWSQALSLGVVPQNVESAGRHLASLIDELCHVTGHRSTDFSWYTHRASVGMVYVSTGELRRTCEGFTTLTWNGMVELGDTVQRLS